MRRFRLILLALALLGGSLLVAPPATAHTTTCPASGNFSTGTKMTMTGPAVKTSFAIMFTVPAGCSNMSGTITGNCATSSGSGGSFDHSFRFTGVGNTLVFEGAVKGTLTIFREGDTLPCDHQDRFKVAGTLTYTH
jgi:hypothetical protein